MKKIVVLGFMFVFLSCQDNEVMLPQADETIVSNVKDFLPVYFFFKTVDKDTLIEVNKNNLKSVTNWAFNIDNRLSLRKVILEIKKLQVYKHSENYFIYTDTVNKSKAFLPFSQVKFKLEKPDFDVVYFYLDRNDLVHFKDEVFSKDELQTYLDKQTALTSILYFAYDKGMTFGKYIEYQFFVKNLVAPKGNTINTKKVFIY